MEHIKHLEDEIARDIAWVQQKGGYKHMGNVRELKDKLELWHLLHKFHEHHGHHTGPASHVEHMPAPMMEPHNPGHHGNPY